MSRIAKYPVPLPGGVQVVLGEKDIVVKGPLGEARQALSSNVSVVQEGKELRCTAVGDSIEANAMSGTMRALLANMIKGVSEGFMKKLTLVGVGYRAQAKGDVLSLALGYSHPIEHKMPEGIKVETPTQTEIVIKGIDKQKVGQVAAEVRAYRRPEPYKGKGVRYADEVVIIKETKKK
ncbi:MAG TPA: 50S ribosomal protein L6 [Burkholderiales bacterium]|nr:50S ribosomal protein L6 [Burkholderiales bacterium]